MISAGRIDREVVRVRSTLTCRVCTQGVLFVKQA